jgi:hypothetical protein
MTYEEDFVVEPFKESGAQPPKPATPPSNTDQRERVRDRFEREAIGPFLRVASGPRFAASGERSRRGRTAREAARPDRHQADPLDVTPPWEEEGKPHPVNWCTLGPDEAEREWARLDAWVYWLRDRFGLTPQEVPPAWHRHDPLVWELSALRTAWLACHAPDASPLAPLTWLRDFHDARDRLRQWVQDLGTELKQDRPTREVTWPGEPALPNPGWETIVDRASDFGVHVADDVTARQEALAEAEAAVAAERAGSRAQLLALTRPDLAGRDLAGGIS